MLSIELTKEQVENLCNELARLTTQFKGEPGIKCIYFIPFKRQELPQIYRSYIEITFVCEQDDDKLKRKLEECNITHISDECYQKYGVELLTKIDSPENYALIDFADPNKYRRSNSLMNSQILYDATGLFANIKRCTEETVEASGEITDRYYWFSDLGVIHPPIEKKLEKAIKGLESK